MNWYRYGLTLNNNSGVHSINDGGSESESMVESGNRESESIASPTIVKEAYPISVSMVRMRLHLHPVNKEILGRLLE